MIRIIAGLACVGLLAGCSVPVSQGTPFSNATEAGEASTSSPMESPGPCRAAPAWLVHRLERTLLPPGSGLTRIFVARAAAVRGDDEMSSLSDAWWVAALINGAGVRPAPAVWLVETLDGSSSPRIWAADVNARRYSSASRTDSDLEGDGLSAVRACVGPAPQP